MNDFATIQKWRWDRLQRIGSAYKQDLTQVDRNINIMILNIKFVFSQRPAEQRNLHWRYDSVLDPKLPIKQLQDLHGNCFDQSYQFRLYWKLQQIPVNITWRTYNNKIGSLRPAFLRAWTMRPGPLATYVLRWPRISASSRTPPREIRWNGRLRAFATDWPRDVFPVPGGPTKLKAEIDDETRWKVRWKGKPHSRMGPLIPFLLALRGFGGTTRGVWSLSCMISSFPCCSSDPFLSSSAARRSATASRSPFNSLSLTTARYSIRRFLIFSKPKWSESSCTRAACRKDLSFNCGWTWSADTSFDVRAEFGQGTEVSHSSCTI